MFWEAISEKGRMDPNKKKIFIAVWLSRRLAGMEKECWGVAIG